MEQLINLLGHEHDVDEVARRLYAISSGMNAPVVGAMHVTCSDESERECVEAFRHGFSNHLLPNLKFGKRSHFRTANLGGRYERGSVHIANQHFSAVVAAKQHKLLLVKLNSHVCAETSPEGYRFGSMRRYDSESVYCGALHALMEGSPLPFAQELEEVFVRDGRDRLRLLMDETRIEPAMRSLYAAVVNACLQARLALDDTLSQPPASPTRFVIVPCVTLNRASKDTEIVCGVHRVDWRTDEPLVEYTGLDDDPAGYRCKNEWGSLAIEDDRLRGAPTSSAS
jgi:hypothetical protein